MNRLRRLAFASIIAITVAVDLKPSSAQLVYSILTIMRRTS